MIGMAAARRHGTSRPFIPDGDRGKGNAAEGTKGSSSSSSAHRTRPSSSSKPQPPPLPPGLLHWKKLLQQEIAEWTAPTRSPSSSSRVPYDIFIDGANVGYYGVSKWAEVAAAQHKWLPGGPSDGPHLAAPSKTSTPSKISSCSSFRVQEGTEKTKSKKKCFSAVRVQLDFALIDKALTLVTTGYGFRRPLILLHARHCRAEYLTKENAAILKRWEAKRVVYASPFGSNDDAWWLYGALFLHPYSPLPSSASLFSPSLPSGKEKEGEEKKVPASEPESIRPSGVYVLTNDKCRDHHFQFLSPRCFGRWREQFCIGFHCERENGVTRVRLDWPPAYSYAPQKILWKETKRKGPSVSTGPSGKRWCWHIPVAGGTLSTSLQRTTNTGNEEEHDDAMSPSKVLVEREEPEDQKWVCVAYDSPEENG